MAHWDKGLGLMAGLALSFSLVPHGAFAGQDAMAPARQGHRLSGRPAGKPAYLWLWYPDESGAAVTEEGPFCKTSNPPAYQCTFAASLDDCKRQIQSYLDAWYADFNLVFSLTRPNADYYTIVVTNNDSWCPHDPTEVGVAGVAFSSGCNDITGFAGYVFACDNAHDCATVIAHEHAHMVGLEHTDSIRDVMNRRVQPTAAGFDNQENATVDDLCNLLSQNSYERMLSVLGAWPGGAKPRLFADAPDAGPADAAADGSTPVDGGSSGTPIGPGGGIDSGLIGVVGGYDALVRPTLPTVDAAAATSKSGGGCSHAGPRATAASVFLALLGLLLVALTRARARCPARRERRAGEPPPCASPARRPSAVPAHGYRWLARPRRR